LTPQRPVLQESPPSTGGGWRGPRRLYFWPPAARQHLDATDAQRDARDVPRYLHVWLILVLLAGCDSEGGTGASATAPPRPTPAPAIDRGPSGDRIFVYELRGRARGVEVAFVAGDGRRLQRRVDAPWTSREMTAPADAQLRLTASAPRGTNIECVLKHRRPRGRYGGNGSGESSQISDPPHTCDLNNVSPR
jgi:hypothetical protein